MRRPPPSWWPCRAFPPLDQPHPGHPGHCDRLGQLRHRDGIGNFDDNGRDEPAIESLGIEGGGLVEIVSGTAAGFGTVSATKISQVRRSRRCSGRRASWLWDCHPAARQRQGLTTAGAGGTTYDQNTAGISGTPHRFEDFGGSLAAAYVQDADQASLIIAVPTKKVHGKTTAGLVHQLSIGSRGPDPRHTRTFSPDSPGVKGRLGLQYVFGGSVSSLPAEDLQARADVQADVGVDQ